MNEIKHLALGLYAKPLGLDIDSCIEIYGLVPTAAAIDMYNILLNKSVLLSIHKEKNIKLVCASENFFKIMYNKYRVGDKKIWTINYVKEILSPYIYVKHKGVKGISYNTYEISKEFEYLTDQENDKLNKQLMRYDKKNPSKLTYNKTDDTSSTLVKIIKEGANEELQSKTNSILNWVVENRFDSVGAMKYIDDNRDSFQAKYDENGENMEYQYWFRRYSINNMTNKKFSIEFDGTGGRLHTNLTNMPTDIREGFIKYNHYLDIKNSQLALLASHIYNEYINSNTEAPSDVIKLRELASNGMFYEHFGNIVGLDASIPTERKQLKSVVFQAIYNHSIYYQGGIEKSNNELLKAFVEEFPNAWDYIYKVHSNHCKIKCSNTKQYIDKKRGHLAAIMQRVESDVINSVLFYFLNKGYRVLSVYDGLMFFDDINESEVKDLIKNEFEKNGYLVSL